MIPKIAYVISFVFHPIFLFFHTFIFLLFYSDFFINSSAFISWFIISYIAITTILLPLLLIYIFTKDFALAEKEQRTTPYLIIIFVYLLMLIFFNKFSLPSLIKNFISGIIISLIIVLIINRYIKISIHSFAIAGILALFLKLFLFSPIDFYIPLMITALLAGIIGTSRLILETHSEKELYLGYLVGFPLTFILLTIL